MISEYLDVSSLYRLRSISKAYCSIISQILIGRQVREFEGVSQHYVCTAERVTELIKDKLKKLKHYSSFLASTSVLDIYDTIWCQTPPQELLTLCRCLCIFYLVSRTNNSLLASEHMDSKVVKTILPWHFVRNTMSDHRFRIWYSNLKTAINNVPNRASALVEEIIVSDTTITYDRLREISPVGYKLLIIISASLQHCLVRNDVMSMCLELKTSAEKLNRLIGSIQLLKATLGAMPSALCVQYYIREK